jgi:TetR/AcrR family transcriptional repressor of nem operon
MPHPKDRKQKTRNRILNAAARLFATRGFRATSIDAVMHECGLTHGGFYAHFRSKAHLYKEAFDLPGPVGQSPEIREVSIDGLLAACATGVGASEWASLSNDVTSPSREVRERYTRTIKALCDVLSTRCAGNREQAAAQAAMLVGALAICATTDDRVLRKTLIGACRLAIQTQRIDEAPALFWMVDHALARPSLENVAAH